MALIKLLPEVDQKIKDAAIIEKTKKSIKKIIKKSTNILNLIELIRQDVEEHLGKFKADYQCIRTEEEFDAYIEKANAYGKIAIDTETTGLNPLVNQIVGLCLYFPGEKGAYVPINHVDYISGNRLDNQLNEETIGKILKKLTAKIIMHNAPFDIRVILHTCGVRLKCWWDTQVGATLLNENEPHGLKYLHGKYISHTDEKTFSELFGAVTFTNIPIEYAYLYATHDAVDTFEVYEFQEKFFSDNSRPDRVKLNSLFRNIEIPMIDVIIDLEDNGVAVDQEYLKILYDKYHKNLEDALNKCNDYINANYKEKIETYKALNPNCKLDDPISISSSTQLAILFYDILKAKPIKGKGARCTDADVMETLKKKGNKLAEYILDYRTAQKLTSTYIDNIPNVIHTDGRVHTHFNSNGAATGRMSSSDPINLQNIPSHNNDIRKMFIGQTTYRDVESDSNIYEFDRCEELELKDGTWKFVEQLKPNEELVDGEIVKSVKIEDLKVFIEVY